MGRNILKSSVKDASFSIVFQILFRCITFVLNAFIIRHVGQEVLGIMNVRLLLLESTILFLSREPILKACLSDTKSHNWAQVINQVWLSVPLSAGLGVVLVYVWLNVLSATEEQYLTQYKIGCYAIAFSCVLNQITQGVLLVAQSFCFIKLKVIFDAIYILFRTAIFVFLVIKDPTQAINAFSIAQIASAVLYCLLYYAYFTWYIHKLNKRRLLLKAREDNNSGGDLKTKDIFADMHDFPFKSIFEMFPGFMYNVDKPLNKDLCVLTVSFAKQCVIKQVLTEGERYVMTISPLLTFSEQSMYDIVNNLGSLAARFVFRPIEESAYFYFTQMIKREQPVEKQDQKNIHESATVLQQLCKVVASIGMVVVVFGQTYSHTLLFLYGGRVLTENELPTILLKCHCFAIVLLAINGVTEGFVFATMDSKQLDRYNYVMVIFSVSFLLISYVFTSVLGPVGFILANCVNMLARIIHSIHYIKHMYKNTNYRPLEGLKPDIFFISILVVSYITTRASELYIFHNSVLLHITIGGIFFLLTLATWAFLNKDLWRLGVNKYKRRISLKTD